MSIVGTSLLSLLGSLALLKLGAFKLIASDVTQIVETALAAKLVASADDSPVTVRGGSIIASVDNNDWAPDNAANPSYWTAQVNDKTKIYVSRKGHKSKQVLPSAMDWVILINSRDVNGNDPDDGKHGLRICSKQDCSTGTAISNNDPNVYLFLINPADDIFIPPDINDDGTDDDDSGNTILLQKFSARHITIKTAKASVTLSLR